MNRDRLVRELAPAAPPCFSSRDQWVEYLATAAVHQRLEHVAGPLLFEPGEPVRFDPTFSYCADCNLGYRSAMLKRDRCKPTFVREQYHVAPQFSVMAMVAT